LAKRGYTMIGIETSKEMLAVARQKPFSDQIQWIHGDAQKLEGLQADLVLMTSHVAQFLLEEKSWQSMLTAAHKAIKPGGHIMFDSKNPLAKPWERWTRKMSRKTNTPYGEIEMWYNLLEIKKNRAIHEIHYLFTQSGEELLSINELIYRTKEELTKSLEEAGFVIEHTFGDWDSSPANAESPEFIFVAVHE